MIVVALLAVATVAAHALAYRLDRKARVIVHPEFVWISAAAAAYIASLILTLALAATIAAVIV